MAARYGIKYFYDITDRSDFRANPDYKGVCHIAMAQEGHCKPGASRCAPSYAYVSVHNLLYQHRAAVDARCGGVEAPSGTRCTAHEVVKKARDGLPQSFDFEVPCTTNPLAHNCALYIDANLYCRANAASEPQHVPKKLT